MSYIMQFFRIIWQSEIFYRNSIFLGSMKQPMFKIWRNLNYPFSIIILSCKSYAFYKKFIRVALHYYRYLSACSRNEFKLKNGSYSINSDIWSPVRHFTFVWYSLKYVMKTLIESF